MDIACTILYCYIDNFTNSFVSPLSLLIFLKIFTLTILIHFFVRYQLVTVIRLLFTAKFFTIQFSKGVTNFTACGCYNVNCKTC